MTRTPPRSIETLRLLLRAWKPSDAPLLNDAIAHSRAELERFTPWVIPDPPELTVLEERLTKFRDQFDAGENFIYGIFDHEETRVLGGVGLYARVGAGALEVGYWVRSDCTGRGYASEAAWALTAAAFEHCDVERVELICEEDNTASAAIPRKLGFLVKEIREEPPRPPRVDGRRVVVWQMLAPAYQRLAQPVAEGT